jgi:hypothetical protein
MAEIPCRPRPKWYNLHHLQNLQMTRKSVSDKKIRKPVLTAPHLIAAGCVHPQKKTAFAAVSSRIRLAVLIIRISMRWTSQRRCLGGLPAKATTKGTRYKGCNSPSWFRWSSMPWPATGRDRGRPAGNQIRVGHQRQCRAAWRLLTLLATADEVIE